MHPPLQLGGKGEGRAGLKISEKILLGPGVRNFNFGGGGGGDGRVGGGGHVILK